MAKAETNVVIDRPVEEVFTFFTNFENSPKWQSGVIEVQLLSEGPMAAGSTYLYVGEYMGRRTESEGLISEYEPNRLWGAKFSSGPFSAHEQFLFEPSNGGTKLTALVDGEVGGLLRLAEPIMIWFFRRQLEGDFAKLKELLEN
ncbi:MAG: SRPBCC family protein [Planctomycetota bacterium]|jgi:uncharacterized protein YndB with AHSA1/START domain